LTLRRAGLPVINRAAKEDRPLDTRPNVLNISDEAVRAKIYEVILSEIKALDPKVVAAVNVDVTASVITVLGCLPLDPRDESRDSDAPPHVSGHQSPTTEARRRHGKVSILGRPTSRARHSTIASDCAMGNRGKRRGGYLPALLSPWLGGVGCPRGSRASPDAPQI
jgi:hypothetical protein